MIFSAGKHEKNYHQNHWVIWVTLLLGLVIDHINLPNQLNLLLPSFTSLILFYWVLAISKRTFLITAIIIGILHDALLNTPLGSHGVIYLLLIYPILHIRLQLRNAFLLQMSLFVGFWMLLHQALIWLFNLGRINQEDLLLFWLAPVVTVLLWPLLFIILRTIRKRMQVS